MTGNAAMEPPQEETAVQSLSRRRREIQGIINHVEDALTEVALNHSGRAGLAKGFHVWQQPGRLMRKVKRAASALLHRNLLKGLNGWKAMLAEKKRRLAKLRQAASSFLNRAVRKAQNQWSDHVLSRKLAFDNLTAAARQWVNRAIAAAWVVLIVLGEERRKAKRAMASFVNRPLKQALNAWVAMAADRKRLMHALQGGANTFANRKTRAALNSWEAMVASKAEALAELDAVGSRWMNRAIAACWPKFVALGEARRKAKRIGSSFMNRPLVQALNTWMEMATVQGRRLDALRAGASTFTNRKTRAALNSWESVAHADAARRQLVRHAAGAFVNRALASAFRMLVATHVIESRSEQQRSEQENTATRALGTLINRHLARAYNQWAGRSTLDAHTYTLFERAGLLLRSKGLLRGLEAFAFNAEPPPPPPPPPRPQPLPIRLRKLARSRAPRPLARTVRVPADDKLKVVRLLLTPYAALVMRADGALLRVTDVRKPGGTDALCVVEFANGVDEHLLAPQPLPPEIALARASQSAASKGVHKVSAADICAPGYPLLVPGFFGGVLPLANGLFVKV